MGFDFMYVQGYKAALLDVLNVIEYIQDDLKVHHVGQSAKTYMGIVNAMIQGRAILRENPDAFVRCNSDGGFEVYIEGKGVM